MWENIQETLYRALGGTIYNIFGGVGISLTYDSEEKEITLIIYDKSYKCADKEEDVNEKFKYDLEKSYELKAKADIVEMIENYLIQNYS